jgi:WXXGXW repeat (2 copies)
MRYLPSRVLRDSRHAPAPKRTRASYVAIFTATAALLVTGLAAAQVAISVNIAPPALPVYEQPQIPAPGYIWTPGYWAYGPQGYFWVPGTWVEPPAPGLLWTPGFWAWSNGAFIWNAGYWAPEVGFYGGIDYGYGYGGSGYQGGYWQNNQFYYNRSVNNVSNTNITNVYSKTVVNNVTVNKVSYNGGNGGVSARPTPQEEAVAHQPHHGPTPQQQQHASAARSNHDLLASVNHGRPPIAATPKPGSFSGPGIVHARGAAPAPAARNAPPEHAPSAAEHAPPGAPVPGEQHPRRLAEARGAAPPAHERPAPRPGETPEASPRPEPAPHANAPRPPEGHAVAPRPSEQHAAPGRPGSAEPKSEGERRPQPERKPQEERKPPEGG